MVRETNITTRRNLVALLCPIFYPMRQQLFIRLINRFRRRGSSETLCRLDSAASEGGRVWQRLRMLQRRWRGVPHLR